MSPVCTAYFTSRLEILFNTFMAILIIPLVPGYEREDPLNPQIFFPCLNGVFDKEYGFFEPLIFVLYPITLPPIAACPQVDNKNTLRCLAISKEDPKKFVPCSAIRPGSRVCISIHGYLEEYDEPLNVLMTSTCFQSHDWGVLIDWARMADPRTIGRVRVPLINSFLSLTNPILNGRITCNIARYLMEKKKVREENLRVLGFSAGTQFLSPMAEYCRRKYNIHFHHMIAIELPFIPYRRSNYPIVNHTSARFVDVIFTTKSPKIAVVDEALALLSRLGYFEVIGDCVYYANPERLLLDQGPCILMPGTPCTHYFSLLVFISAYSGKCLYRYHPCPPEIIENFSNQEVGLTRLNCADHPYLKRTCFKTSSNPLRSC